VRSLPRVPFLACLLVVAAPTASSAEWQFTPFVGYTFKGSTTLVDDEIAVGTRHWHLGGSIRLLGDSPFGVEALYVHTPGFFERDESELTSANLPATVTESRAIALMGNFVLTTPRRWNQYGLRPYLSAGLGLMHVTSLDLGDIHPIRLNLLGMNAGGGAVGFVSDRVGLRFDLRYFRKVRAPDWTELDPAVSIGPIQLRYWTTSIGVVFKY
jgi:hypothetical protein